VPEKAPHKTKLLEVATRIIMDRVLIRFPGDENRRFYKTGEDTMENDKEFIKRTTIVVDKRFQFRFVATFLLIIILSLAFFSGGVAVFYWIRYAAGDNVFNEFIQISKQMPRLDADGKPMKNADGSIVTESVTSPPEVGGRFKLVLPPILNNNLVIMIIISVLGIFYSHRIAGPVYRMQQDIEKALGGEKGVRVQLRKGDKLKDLATKVNALIEAYEKK
jgi:methyl-accepting chemotaxis protein